MTDKKHILKSATIISLVTVVSRVLGYVRDQRITLLLGTTLSADAIAGLLTKGDDAKKPPHKKAMSGLPEADAKAVAEFVKTLK